MTARAALVGAFCWILTLGYFLAEVVVAAAWPDRYSFQNNLISDLGVTTCGPIVQFGGESVSVCSPRHGLMNVSFVLTAALTGMGAVLLRRWWPPGRMSNVAMVCIVMTGVGGILVGLAPQNVNLPLHAVGTLLQLPGLVAPLLLCVVWWRHHRGLALLSLVCGALGVAGLLLFLTGFTDGLGVGGAERLAVWPLTVWTAVVGVVALILRPVSDRTPADVVR